MKKLISTLLASVMLLGAGHVFADYEEYVDSNEPLLLYNNTIIGDEEFYPFIYEGRTMLPFRFFLKEINAEVDYDENSRIVHATKDDTTVTFSLDESYIDITKNGSTERTYADVPNIIDGDRVYVPIRFLSQAFDMNVGWDEYAYTAIIVDIPQYVKELGEKAPELKRYMEIGSKVPDNYTQTAEMTLDFSWKEEYSGQNYNFNMGLDMESSLNNGDLQTDAAVNLDTNLFKLSANMDIDSLKDVKFTFIYKNDQFYAKTNLIEKLKEVLPDNEELNNVSALVSENMWFKADLSELLEEAGIPAEMTEMLKSSLRGELDNNLNQVFKILATDIVDVYQAQMIDQIFEMYGVMFANMFTVTDLGDNCYDVKMELSKDTFTQMMSVLGGEMTEEDQELFDAMVFALTGTAKIEDNVNVSSDMKFTFSFEEGNAIVLNMTMNMQLVQDTNKEIVEPQSALDLNSLIQLLN